MSDDICDILAELGFSLASETKRKNKKLDCPVCHVFMRRISKCKDFYWCDLCGGLFILGKLNYKGTKPKS